MVAELTDALRSLAVLDAHTHLVGGRLGARGLHDILLYHMAVSDLYAAGCPTGARLTQYPGWPSTEEAHDRIRQALPYLPHVRNTSTSWGIRVLLRDLYDWHEPVEAGNWAGLDAIIRERADDRTWHREVMRRANICRFCTELARREDGCADAILQYSLEWAFFTRAQWGEYDTALYELERCWGTLPTSPTPIGGGQRPATERTIRSLDDVHAAVDHYVRSIPAERIVSLATHISTDINLHPLSDHDMAEALVNRSSATVRERDMYASYVNEVFLTQFEAMHGDRIAFQFSFGAEPLPFETGSRVSQQALAELGHMIAGHPGIRFQCFLASRHANQSLCTLCRELPNLSLAGYWWHNFFPSVMRQVMEERLDMLPTNRQIGFFSDAYCIEWAYAKWAMVRSQLAAVLAGKIEQGQYTKAEALEVARAVLYDAPQQLLGMRPADG